jgi:hypothetical protein
MGKNQKRIIMSLGIIFVAFSVAVFALPFKMNAIFWISYIFAVFSIGIQMYVMKIAFDGEKTIKSKFYGFPIAQIGIIYMAVQVLLSFICMICAGVMLLPVMIIVYVLLLAIAALGLISTDAMRDEVVRQDKKLKEDVSCITTLRSLVYPLAAQCEDEKAKAALKDIADDFRYSDPVSSDALKDIESELELCVEKLKKAVMTENVSDILACSKNTKVVLQERNRLCKLGKNNK